MKLITGEQQDLFEYFDSLESVAVKLADAGSFMRPGDFEAMYMQKQAWHAEYHVNKGNWRPYRGWASNQFNGKDSNHFAESFDADLRCQHSWRQEESKQVGYGYKWDIPVDYPPSFQQSGAPIRDCRGESGNAMRHVPGANQFGGLKVGTSKPCTKHL